MNPQACLPPTLPVFGRQSLLLTLGLFFLFTAQGQDILASLNDTAMVKTAENAATSPQVAAKKWNQIKTKWFTMNIGAAVLLDHNILSQDAKNLSQVGKVNPGTEFRGDRLIATGSFFLKAKLPWRYMVSLNFNGLDAPAGKKSLEFIDWNIDVPISKSLGWLTLGKQKEGVGLEYVSPGTQLFFTERSTAAPMFVRQRNIGIRYSNVVLQERMSYTLGFFNNHWETGKSFAENGTQFTARVTGLPQYHSDRHLLHLGLGFRSTGASSGTLGYKAKPEANTAPAFINTGSFAANNAQTLLLEGIWVHESLALLAEYMTTNINSAVTGNPRLAAWQLGGSWFLTGENRRYNKTTGNLGKLVPKRNFKFRKGSGWGAVEMDTRYTHTQGTNAGLAGGNFSRWTWGLSWYPNVHFRYSFNYGWGNLDQNGVIGKTHFYQFRIQFEL